MSLARRLNVRSVLVVRTIHLPSPEENMPAGTEAPSSLPVRSRTTPSLSYWVITVSSILNIDS
jgi:hypothetical protein